MTDVLDAAALELMIALGHQHPAWCQNLGDRADSDGCAIGDPDTLVLHSRRDAACIPAVAENDHRPTEVGVNISCEMHAGDEVCTTVALISVPTIHANLDRQQLRLLIAELQHIDRLWELS